MITLCVFPDVIRERLRWAEEVAEKAGKMQMTIPVADADVLLRILEKAPAKDVDVLAVQDGGRRIYRLTDGQKERLLELLAEHGADALLNLDHILFPDD